MTKFAFTRCAGALVLLGGLIGLPTALVAEPAAADIVPPGAKLEKLFEGACILTEGVAAGHDGMIYFSDITFTFTCTDKDGNKEAGHIWKFNPNTGETTVFVSHKFGWIGAGEEGDFVIEKRAIKATLDGHRRCLFLTIPNGLHEGIRLFLDRQAIINVHTQIFTQVGPVCKKED